MKKLIYNIFLLSAVVLTSACETYLDEEPVDQISDAAVIEDATSAEATLLGAYSELQQLHAWLAVSMPGVLSDELIHSGSFPSVNDMDNNAMQSNNTTMDDHWINIYDGVYIANIVIEKIEGGEEIEGLTPELSNQLLGEAKFLRAYFHFEGARLWGGIPLALSTDLEELSSVSRATEEASIQAVISDLLEAETLLSGVAMDDAPYRASEWAVKALLARVYLYNGDVSTAGDYADEVITSGLFPLQGNYPDIYGGDSDEVIFRSFQSSNDQNDLAFYFLPSGRFELAVSDKLVNSYTAGDTRAMFAQAPSGLYYVNKYTDVATGTDEVPIIRSAEMYLIRAEANIGNAQGESDLETVMARAGLDVSGSNPATLDAILEQRFLELAFEGHRWYDLKRTGEASSVMSVINPSTWSATDVLMPIPFYDLTQNTNLVQNDGY